MTFYELEKKCKRRRFLKFLFLLFVIFIIIIGTMLYFNFTVEAEKDKQTIKKQKTVLKKKEKIKKNISLQTQTKQILLLPYIDLNITEKKVSKTKKIKKMKKENNTSIILKTQTLPSFDTCISIARKYLESRDYKNALKWAKNANIQNRKDPLSWIISAKALYHMGKKHEAVKLLKIYNSYYNNKEIKKLIKEYNEK